MLLNVIYYIYSSCFLRLQVSLVTIIMIIMILLYIYIIYTIRPKKQSNNPQKAHVFGTQVSTTSLRRIQQIHCRCRSYRDTHWRTTKIAGKGFDPLDRWIWVFEICFFKAS